MEDPASHPNNDTMSSKHRGKPVSPAPSSVSMRSGDSMKPPYNFRKRNTPRLPPALSSVSMRSDASMKEPPHLHRGKTSVPRPEPSCVLFYSNCSMELPNTFAEKPLTPQTKTHRLEPSCVSFKSNCSMELPNTLADKSLTPETKLEPSCVSFKSNHSMELPNTFADKPLTPNTKPKKKGNKGTTREATAKCSDVKTPRVHASQTKSQRMTGLTEDPQYLKYKSYLKTRFQRLSNGTQSHDQSMFLNEIYTELYITEGDSGEINNEHEVRQIEMTSRTVSAEETSIKCNDIFNLVSKNGCNKSIRTVLTKGVAGIGKTVSVQKFILDWVEGKANQDVHFIFPLPFRELNLLSQRKFSLEGLIKHFFPLLKDVDFSNAGVHKIVFIFDGLDELRRPLDFCKVPSVCDVSKPNSVDVLLTNLLKGCLLPSALVWVTSRPAATGQIPSKFVCRVTEIRGFNDAQKEEYFRKRIGKPNLADKVITHMKSSRSLYIMCHIPVFCWISATVLERMLTESEGAPVPKTLTQMYTHFLVIQTHARKEKYDEIHLDDWEMVSKLGCLAFRQLVNGNLIFYEADLRECGIDVKDAVVYSGICTEIFREDFELTHGMGKVFCFVHLSIQEHLAALYVHLSFCKGDQTILNLLNPKKLKTTICCSSLSDLHKSAVDKTLQSDNGQFDLFLRFLLGISQEGNRELLGVLLPHLPVYTSESAQETAEYIKIRIRMNLLPEKYINLFHCLNELNDFSLEEEIQTFQSSGRLSKTKLTPSQWSALVFVLLTSDRELEVFDLRKYSMNNADECLQRMLPVVMASKTSEVRHCNLTENGFQALAKALSSKSSNLRELKLSGNKLHGSSLQILSEGLRSSHCKLEILELSDCSIDSRDCSLLAESLTSNPSPLRELDVSFNILSDAGIKPISDILRSPHCRLEKLKLLSCDLTEMSCQELADALRQNSSLIELDLSKNDLWDHGIELLSAGLKNARCKLRCLSLEDCNVRQRGSCLLFTTLKCNPNELRELCLNWNQIRDQGAVIASQFLQEPHCKLEKLRLSYCNISDKGFSSLALALKLNPSHLSELELTGNKAQNSEKQKLSALQQNKDFKLEKLKL